jgi:hypothetical protein
MASMSTDFYATLEEIVGVVERALGQEQVYAVAIEFSPDGLVPLTTSSVRGELIRDTVRRVVFADSPLLHAARGYNGVLDHTNGALILDIGRLTPSGLVESHLSSTDATKAWRKVFADLKRNTLAGMCCMNEKSGASAAYRTLRYTSGAAALEGLGVPLRPSPSTCVRCRPSA